MTVALKVLSVGFLASFSLVACVHQGTETLAAVNAGKVRIDWESGRSLSLQAAQRILGEPGNLQESFAYLDGDAKNFVQSFFAMSPDSASGNTGALYFRFVEYPTEPAGLAAYQAILTANAAAPGLTEVTGMGQAGYFQVEAKTFWFMVSRYGTGLAILKLNKVTSHSNYPEFEKVAYAIWGDKNNK